MPLLFLVTVGVMGIGFLTFNVWSNQYQTVRTTLIQERQQSIQLLTFKFERQVDAVITRSLRYLFEDDLALVPGRINAVEKRFPALKQVMHFDAEGGMVYCIPGPSIMDDYRRLIAARLKNSVRNRPLDDLSVGSFLEDKDGEQNLFVFAPMPSDHLSLETPGWLILRFTVAELIRDYWHPLKLDFEREQGGQISLLNKNSEAMHHLALSGHLPGWLVSYQPEINRVESAAKQQGLLLAMLILGLGSLPITSGLAYWWYSRRRLMLAKAKGEFVAHITHELKTPLTLIRMYAETLEMARIKDPKQARIYLQTIIKESDHLTTLIDQVLAYAKMEHAQGSLPLSETNLADTVRTILLTYQPTLEKSQFALEIEISPTLPSIPHHPDSLRTIVLNLLDNAVKYSPHPHTILLRMHQTEGGVTLEVVDQGQGFDDKISLQLLQPFVRGAEDEYSAKSGAGLGLSMVKQAVALHEGSFELTNGVGAGSIARVFFPSPKYMKSARVIA